MRQESAKLMPLCPRRFFQGGSACHCDPASRAAKRMTNAGKSSSSPPHVPVVQGVGGQTSGNHLKVTFSVLKDIHKKRHIAEERSAASCRDSVSSIKKKISFVEVRGNRHTNMGIPPGVCHHKSCLPPKLTAEGPPLSSLPHPNMPTGRGVGRMPRLLFQVFAGPSPLLALLGASAFSCSFSSEFLQVFLLIFIHNFLYSSREIQQDKRITSPSDSIIPDQAT